MYVTLISLKNSYLIDLTGSLLPRYTFERRYINIYKSEYSKSYESQEWQTNSWKGASKPNAYAPVRIGSNTVVLQHQRMALCFSWTT